MIVSYLLEKYRLKYGDSFPPTRKYYCINYTLVKSKIYVTYYLNVTRTAKTDVSTLQRLNY